MPVDFERGAKTTGAKFYFTTGDEARQEWDLISRMLAYHQANGYTFVIPPYLVRRQTAEWAGILPRFEGDFYLTTDDLVLIPTAETALVGMHAQEIIPDEQLPLKYVAFSPCFRREAGAGGKRDKGLRRVHQFHKVELFVICKPQDSERLHQEMLAQVQALMDALGVTHRTVELPEHDRSPVSAKTYDVELQCGEEWLEVSSISNTEARQSGPALIRYKERNQGKTIRCHMLNGSGVALPRLLLAVNDGSRQPIMPVKQPTVPAEDATIERELWAGDQANTQHEERAARELYRRRLRIEKLEAALRPFATMAERNVRADADDGEGCPIVMSVREMRSAFNALLQR